MPTMTRNPKSTKPISGKTPVSGVPASQRKTAPPCQTCRSENTIIYCTRGDSEFRTHYCKCKRCGWTWPEVSRVKPS